MSIADQILRLNNAKAAIKQSIENKGVSVNDNAKLDEYAAFIDTIKVGGSGSDSSYNNPNFYDMRTVNGTTYKGLFSYYSGSSIDLIDFDSVNVTDMSYMFYNANQVTAINHLSNLKTSNVKDIGYMFYGCQALTSIDLSALDLSNITNLTQLFNGCRNLASVNIGDLNGAKIKSLAYTFGGCQVITSIDLSGVDTSNVTAANNLFQNCYKLTTINMDGNDFSKATTMMSMFGNCSELTNLTAPMNIKAATDLSACTKLTHDSLMSVINNLMTVTSSVKLTLGSANLAKLTNTEKAIATNKNWTLA